MPAQSEGAVWVWHHMYVKRQPQPVKGTLCPGGVGHLYTYILQGVSYTMPGLKVIELAMELIDHLHYVESKGVPFR